MMHTEFNLVVFLLISYLDYNDVIMGMPTELDYAQHMHNSGSLIMLI